MSDLSADNTHHMDREIRVARDLSIGGDLIGRDKVVHGYSADQVQGLLTELAARYRPRSFDGRCPYPGLGPFHEDDAALFFGRERLIQDVVQRLSDTAALVITGPSGSGKSSLVQAGLLPALKGGALASSPRWRYATLTPGRSPLLALGRALTRLTGSLDAQTDLIDQAFTDPARLTRWLQTHLADDPEQKAVLVVDQFEELFTQTPAEPERRAFIAQLCTAVDQARESLRLVLTLRSDFIGACARYPALNALLSQALVQVGALSPDEMLRAIAAPALQVGLRLDPELIARLLYDGQDEPGALPLLQFALRDLFEAERDSNGVPALTLAGYVRRGGLHQALRRHADSVYATLTMEQQALARTLLSHLVSVGQSEGAPLARRIARLADLPGEPHAVAEVVARFTQARLLIVDDRSDHRSSPSTATVTLAHETLLAAWPLLAEWIAAGREIIRLRATLLDDAAEWARQNRDASYLYAGTRLAVVEEAVGTHRLKLPEEAVAFLSVARQREVAAALTREAARRDELERERSSARLLRTRNRWLLGFAVTAGAFLLLATYNGWNAGRSAAAERTANAEFAVQSRVAFARAAILQAQAWLRAGRRDDALQLAAEAVRVGLSQSPQGIADVNTGLNSILDQALSRGRELTLQLPPDSTDVLSFGKRLSPTQAAFITNDGRVGVWALSDSEVSMLSVPGYEVLDVVRVNGQEWHLGRANDSHSLAVIAPGLDIRLIGPHETWSSHFSPDGSLFLVLELSRATLWSVDSQHIADLEIDGDELIETSLFTPDSQRVLVGASLGKLSLYTNAGHRLARIQGPDQQLANLTTNRNGSLIAASGFASVLIWNDKGEEVANIPIDGEGEVGHANPDRVRALAFNPEGTRLAIGLLDGRILIVDANGVVQTSIQGHQGEVFDLAFSDNGLTFVSVGLFDGAVRVWQTDGSAVAELQPAEHQDTLIGSLVLEAGTGLYGGIEVVTLPRVGQPWAWTVPASITDTLALADAVSHGRLNATYCDQFFHEPCQP